MKHRGMKFAESQHKETSTKVEIRQIHGDWKHYMLGVRQENGHVDWQHIPHLFKKPSHEHKCYTHEMTDLEFFTHLIL